METMEIAFKLIPHFTQIPVFIADEQSEPSSIQRVPLFPGTWNYGSVHGSLDFPKSKMWDQVAGGFH